MDDDEYQQTVDYENDIYELNHGVNQLSESENENIPVRVSQPRYPDGDVMKDSSSNKPTIPKRRNSIPTPNSVYIDARTEDESSNISEDERDMIYSRLYYSTSVVPASAADAPTDKDNASRASPQKKASSIYNTGNPIPSTNFAFEIDLDHLTPTPESASPIIESISEDEDSEFLVHPLLHILLTK